MAKRERPPGARPLRPVQVVLVVVVVLVAIVVGDRLVGSPDTTAEPRTDTSTPSRTLGPTHPSVTDRLSGNVTDDNRGLSRCSVDDVELARCGAAPSLAGVSTWLDNPPGARVDLAALRGHVVLVDFFSYSCGACRRDQSYLSRWDTTYARAGLRVIGVQTPEWDFERDPSAVAVGVRRLGITYPVGLDPRATVFDRYRSTARPAKYLVDARGTVRAIGFGASGYDRTETQIRRLLRAAHPGRPLPRRTALLPPDESDGQPGEIVLGSARQRGYTGGPGLMDGRATTYGFAAELDPSQFTLSGEWTSTGEYLQAGRAARIRISFATLRASMVAAGTGILVVHERGRPTRRVRVTGPPGPVVLFTGHSDLGSPATLDVTSGLRVYALDTQ